MAGPECIITLGIGSAPANLTPFILVGLMATGSTKVDVTVTDALVNNLTVSDALVNNLVASDAVLYKVTAKDATRA